MTVVSGLANFLRTRRAHSHFHFGRPSHLLLLGHKYGFCQTNKAYNMIRSEAKPFVYFVARMESCTIVVGAKRDE